jgi:hypothetical protein
MWRARAMKSRCAVLALAALSTAACSDSGTEPEQSVNSDAFALTLMGMAGTPPTTLGGPQTVACPGGGSRTMNGNATHDQSGDVLTSTWNFTNTMSACVMTMDTFRVELSGQTRSEGHSRVRVPTQAGGSSAILELESHSTGQTTAKQNGRTTSCTHDITQRFNAASNQMRLTGTSCGHTIDMTVPALR